MSKEVYVTTDSFDSEVIQSAVPVLVDFWAPWCGPCKMIGPVLQELSVAYDGKLKVAKVNVDDHPELAGRFNVVSIPMLLVFSGGNVVKQHVGAAPKPMIEALFKDLVG